MQSGCPHSQGAAYPAFQHRSNLGSLTSPLVNNVKPVPVVHPANGMQNNMVATQCSEELRVAYGPAQRQKGNTQSQHFHQLESPASIASTGYQDQKLGQSVCTARNSCHQISRKANADLYSSAHVSAQHSVYFGTSATENSVHNGGKQRGNVNGHFPKWSNLNNNTGLQQRRCLCCALSTDASSAAPLGGGLGITAQTFPSESNANVELTTNFSDERHCKSQQVKTSPVALNCGQTRTQNLDHSGGAHSTPHQQQVSSPSLSVLPSTDKVLPVGETEPPTDDQILNFIAEKLAYFRAILSRENISFCANDRDFTLQSDSSMPKSNSVAHLPATSDGDVERQSLNCASIEQCTAAVGKAYEENTSKGIKANAELTPRSKETGDCTTSASEKHSTEYPQIMMKVAATCAKNEDESPVDELTEKHPSLTLNCSSSQEEYKPPLFNANKNLDDIDQVPGVSWALKHMTEKENGNTGLKPMETVRLDNVHSVTQTKSCSVVSENKRLTSHIENQDANTEKKKNIEDQQHCGVICKEINTHSRLNSSIDKILIHNVSIVTNQSEWLCTQTSCEDAREDEGSVHSKTDLSTALSENKVMKQASLAECEGEEAHSVNILKDPLYEDISDDEDMSQLARRLLNTEHEELTFPADFEDPLYEDISEDENPQTENISMERPSLAEVPERNNKQSIISDEALNPKKQVSPKTESLDIAHHCSCSRFVETDDDFEGLVCPKCDRKRHLGCQTNHSVSCSPSSVLKDEDESDDQMDDDWIVIPISISELKFESEDEDQDGPETVVLDGETVDEETQCELHWPSPKPVPASASSQMEVFDTVESFLQAKAVQLNIRTPQDRQESSSESEDSCETEDSCDYSSGSEHNYLTVSRQLLEKRSAPLPPETDDSMSEKEGEDDEVTNVQNGQIRSLENLGHIQKRRQLIKAGPKQLSKISKQDDIIIVNSDSEDENDQNCKKKAKRKRLFSSVSEDSGDAPCSQRKKHSPETVDSQFGAVKGKFQKNRLPSADSPTPQRKSKLHDTQFKEVMEIACSELSDSTENSGQLIEIKAGSENEVNRQKISKKENIIIIDSDIEDDNDQNYKKANRGRFSSGSVNGGDAPCVQQKRQSSDTVDSECGTANERLQEARLSSADSSLPQDQSKRHDTQFKEMMPGGCSDLSHRIKKNGQLIEPEGGYEHVQHKTNRQTTKRKRIVFHDSDKVVKKDNFSKKGVNILSSGSDDSDDALFAAQNRPSTETGGRFCGAANEKPEKNRLSSDDSPEQSSQCVDQEADSTLVPNPVISRLVVPSFPPNDCLKRLKESRDHRQGKDETGAPKPPTATKKKTASREKNTKNLYRNKKGRFVSKPNPANSRHLAVQANETTPRRVSRQLSLPSQEGPSTSISSLSSTSGQLSEARQSSSSSRGLSGETSASSSLAKSKQSTSIPRQHVSKQQRSNSYSNTTKERSSSVTMLSARTKVMKDWQNHHSWRDAIPGPSHYDRAPRQRHKTRLGMDFRTTNHNSRRDARSGPSHYERAPRQRHNSHESATPLMKKTKIDAINWTKAINREAPREQRSSVGEGYKWSEKPTVAKPTKGSSREVKKYRSPPSPHL